MRSQHCAKAPGRQYPQCWLNIHWIGPVSYKNIAHKVKSIRKYPHIPCFLYIWDHKTLCFISAFHSWCLISFWWKLHSWLHLELSFDNFPCSQCQKFHFIKMATFYFQGNQNAMSKCWRRCCLHFRRQSCRNLTCLIRFLVIGLWMLHRSMLKYVDMVILFHLWIGENWANIQTWISNLDIIFLLTYPLTDQVLFARHVWFWHS